MTPTLKENTLKGLLACQVLGNTVVDILLKEENLTNKIAEPYMALLDHCMEIHKIFYQTVTEEEFIPYGEEYECVQCGTWYFVRKHGEEIVVMGKSFDEGIIKFQRAMEYRDLLKNFREIFS